jgi:tetratricopeptide (TPR) repeat protein
MQKRFVFLSVLCLNCIFLFGQNKESLLQSANVLFEEGDYKKAKIHYEVYRDERGAQDVSKRIADSEKCLELRTLADNYFVEKDYVKAAEKYYAILAINPADKHAASRKSEIKKTAGLEYYGNG